jgi:hypothetical protein
MKHLTLILLLIAFTCVTVAGQSPAGTLKVFTDEPLVVYVDEVHYPRYGEIELVPGTHYVKAINSEGARVYSNIVEVKTGEVTSVLIEAPAAQPAVSQPPSSQPAVSQPPVSGAGVTYGQAGQGTEAGQPADQGTPSENVTASQPDAKPLQPTIDIGQTDGSLPADMGGAFGLTFGMDAGSVDRIMTKKAARSQKNSGYNVYAIPYGSSVYVVECRFIDQKLFQIIVGYPSVYTNKSKLKVDKKEIPFPEFNRIVNDVTANYGEPATAEKIFLGGYTEDDGQILEALKRKKALFLYTWTDPGTGNNIMVGLGYTSAPLGAAIYTSGPLGAEAQARKLKLNGYDYKKTFKDNYFSN